MTTPIVFALLSSAPEAEQAVYALRDAGFKADRISLLYPQNQTGISDLPATINTTLAPEGAVAGATSLGMLGGLGGFLMGLNALLLPGIGPFLIAGPLLAAIGGAAVGVTVGGVAGGLIGLGVSETQANSYDSYLRAGRSLISVHCADPSQAKEVRQILADSGATDISTADSSSTPNMALP